MSNILRTSYKVIPILASLLVINSANASGTTNSKLEKASSTHTILDCQQVDKQLADSLKNSFENSGYNWSENQTEDFDLVDKYNSDIKDTLTHYSQQADSIQCDFPLASKERLSFETSDDKHFRVYTWDENTGGTMHFYSAVMQYIDDNGQSHATYESSLSPETGKGTDLVAGRLYDLGTVKTGDSLVYVLATHLIGSSRDRAIFIKLFQIKHNTLISPKLIKTRSRLTNEVSFSYDTSSIHEKDLQIDLFKFNKVKKSFNFPVVVPSDTYYSGEVTKRRIRYQFDGTYFQRAKN